MLYFGQIFKNNMFIEQGIKQGNDFWRYMVGSFIIATAAIAGQIPFSIAVLIKSVSVGGIPTSEKQIMGLFEPNLLLFLILLSFVFAFVGIYFVVTKFHNQTFLSVSTSRKSIDWNRILFSFCLWAIITIALTLVSFYFNPNDFQINFKPVPFAILFVIATLMLPIQTSVEEYLFRGYLMQGFANLSKNKLFPLVMTSVLFGTMHIFNPEISKLGYIILIYYIGTGFFLGILTLMDGGMELSLGFHAANNLIGALLVTNDWGALQTNSIFKDVSQPNVGAEILIPLLILYPILLIIFSQKYGWTNWKEKLMGKIKY